MASTSMPVMRFDEPWLNADLTPTRRFFAWYSAARTRLGGDDDKVDAAHTLAVAAVPQSTQVVGGGGLSGGASLAGNVGLSLYQVMTSVALLPASATEGDFAYAVDGCKTGESPGSGTGVPCFWSNGAWVAVDSGAAVSA